MSSRLPAQVRGSSFEIPATPLDRFDPAINRLVPANVALQKIAGGFTWTEGPVWLPGGELLFAEVASNSIRIWRPGSETRTFLQPSGYLGPAPYGGPEPGSNGMTLDAQDRLTVAGHAHRDVWRLESMKATASRTVLADRYQGKRLNSPNDLVYRSDGSLYFTDPPYGLRTQQDSDPAKELTVDGVYRLPHASAQRPGAAPKREELQLLVRDLPHPNGLAFSPDEHFLYVDSSEPEMIWMRYTVRPDGGLTEAKLFFDAGQYTHHGAPDGIKVDQGGNVYSAGPGGVWIFSPEGKHLGTIRVPEIVSNVCWGGADHKTLYITASTSLYRISLLVPGAFPHRG